MATAVSVRDEVGQKRAVPLSILLDLGGLDVEARKNILRALKDSYAREMRLRAEVQRLREQTKRERADLHSLGVPA
jgi:hypothetical protein